MSRALVIFPDVEQDVAEGLREFYAARADDFLTGVEVHTTTPTARPARLVTVVRAGGARTYLLERPRLALACWHETATSAFDLASLTGSLFASKMRGFRAIRGITSMTGPVAAPDTDGSPRYLLTVELTVKGAQP